MTRTLPYCEVGRTITGIELAHVLAASDMFDRDTYWDETLFPVAREYRLLESGNRAARYSVGMPVVVAPNGFTTRSYYIEGEVATSALYSATTGWHSEHDFGALSAEMSAATDDLNGAVVGAVYQIEEELLYGAPDSAANPPVTRGASGKVVRGAAGTSAVVHASGTAVKRWEAPASMVSAVARKAGRVQQAEALAQSDDDGMADEYYRSVVMLFKRPSIGGDIEPFYVQDGPTWTN